MAGSLDLVPWAPWPWVRGGCRRAPERFGRGCPQGAGLGTEGTTAPGQSGEVGASACSEHGWVVVLWVEGTPSLSEEGRAAGWAVFNFVQGCAFPAWGTEHLAKPLVLCLSKLKINI